MRRTRLDVDAVVFDYGGVLTTPVRDAIASWIERERIDPDSFSSVLRRWLSRHAQPGTPIHRLEMGQLSIAEFDALLAAELTTVDGMMPDRVGLLAGLFADMRVDPAMVGLVEELRGLGLKVGMLSNSWGNTYPRQLFDWLFDPVVISGEVGLRKPDAAIYELVLAQLSLPAERVVFIDDAEANVEGALAVGMRAFRHHVAATTRDALTALVPGLAGASPNESARTAQEAQS